MVDRKTKPHRTREATRPPLLDVTTIADRPTIKIDGERYEILSPDELSVVDHVWFSTRGKRMAALLAKGRLEKKQADELTAIIDELGSRVMVGVPEDVRTMLTQLQKARIVQVFIGLPAATPITPGETAKAAATSTGARQSRGSSGSTAARPKRGSMKRRSAS